MSLKQAKRVFKYGQITLEDPDPALSVEKVKEFYANVYPELTQSEIDGPKDENGQIVVEFEKTVGTKGTGDRISIADIAKGKAAIRKRNGGKAARPFRPWKNSTSLCSASIHGRNKNGMVLPPSEVLPLV